MKCPASDPDFAAHRVHGVEAQAPLIHEVLGMLPVRRTAVDVGAHIGIWSVTLAHWFERVHAFEPLKENYECLLQNTWALPNVTRYFYALGATPTFAELFTPEKGNSGMSHIAGRYPGSGTIHSVQVSTLDIHSLTDVDLLKIDVEGFEGNVIRGALNTIRKSRPLIVLENNGLGEKYYGSAWEDPVPLLKGLGYRIQHRVRKDEIWAPSR